MLNLEPPGGIEPRAVHPTLRNRLEGGCRGRGYSHNLLSCMVGGLGFEPTLDFHLSIMSRVPATNTSSSEII